MNELFSSQFRCFEVFEASNQRNKMWGMGSTSDPEVVIRWLHGTKKGRRICFDTPPRSLFGVLKDVVMILPQVHLRKPCYDFTFL